MWKILFHHALFAYQNGYLFSLFAVIVQCWISQLKNQLFRICLYGKLYYIYFITLQNPWSVEFERNLLPELGHLILEYSENFCHMCGNIFFQTKTRHCPYQTCTSCIEICLEHYDICCKCCGQWGKIDSRERNMLECLNWEHYIQSKLSRH